MTIYTVITTYEEYECEINADTFIVMTTTDFDKALISFNNEVERMRENWKRLQKDIGNSVLAKKRGKITRLGSTRRWHIEAGNEGAVRIDVCLLESQLAE